MSQKENKLYRLAAKLLSGNVERHEQVSGDQISEQELHQLRKVWQLTGKVEAPAPPTDQWARLYQKIKTDAQRPARTVSMPDRRSTNRPISYFFKIAAVFLAAFISYWLMENLVFGTVSVTTGNGETRVIELADGSTVELNAASELSYPRDKPRNITLDGEAFFEVVTTGAPFWVKTMNSRVTVLGTSFNVHARDHTTRVVVAHGKVALHASARQDSVVLKTKEMSQVTADGRPGLPQKADLATALAWREGRLVFARTPLPEVFATLTRRFDVRFGLANADIDTGTLTATFDRDQTVDEIVSAICLTFSFDCERNENTFEIQSP